MKTMLRMPTLVIVIALIVTLVGTFYSFRGSMALGNDDCPGVSMHCVGYTTPVTTYNRLPPANGQCQGSDDIITRSIGRCQTQLNGQSTCSESQYWTALAQHAHIEDLSTEERDQCYTAKKNAMLSAFDGANSACYASGGECIVLIGCLCLVLGPVTEFCFAADGAICTGTTLACCESVRAARDAFVAKWPYDVPACNTRCVVDPQFTPTQTAWGCTN
jgi:hypothetical protein